MSNERLYMIAINHLKLPLEEAYYVSFAKQLKQQKDTALKFIKSGTNSNLLFINIIFVL